MIETNTLEGVTSWLESSKGQAPAFCPRITENKMIACCRKAEGEKDHLLDKGCEEVKIEFVVRC